MYLLATTTQILGYVEKLTYCYKLSSGSPQVIGRKEEAEGTIATGVIFQGVIYNLAGHDEFQDADTVNVYEIDVGDILNQQAEQIKTCQVTEADTDAMNVDQELRITLLELGIDSEDISI